MCLSVHHSPHHSLLPPGGELHVQGHLPLSVCFCFSNQRVVSKVKYFWSRPPHHFQQKWKRFIYTTCLTPGVNHLFCLVGLLELYVKGCIWSSSSLPQPPPSWSLSHHIYSSFVGLCTQRDRSRQPWICLERQNCWAKGIEQTIAGAREVRSNMVKN